MVGALLPRITSVTEADALPGEGVESLASRLSSGRLPLGDALHIAHDLADALCDLHRRGEIHGALTSASVAFTPDGRATVTNARAGAAPVIVEALDDPHATTTGAALATTCTCATPLYLSPECARGTAPDVRADVWAFGCVLYELLTGRQPFAGSAGAPPGWADRGVDWRELPPSTPASIRRLLHQCLQRDPEQRLDDIAIARTTIEQALGEEAPHSRVVFRRLYPTGIADWVLVLAAIKILLVLAGGAVAGYRAPPRPMLDAIFIAHVVAFGAAGAYMVTAGARDAAATNLGAFFLLTACSFANGLLKFAQPWERVAPVQAVLLALHPEAFLPMFLWRFVARFPHVRRFDAGHGFARACSRIAMAAGVVCFAASALAPLTRARAGVWAHVISQLGWAPTETWYWSVLFVLVLTALPFGLWKARRADPGERRRVSVFMLGLMIGFLPTTVEVLLRAQWPLYRSTVDIRLATAVCYPLLLSIPLTTGYSVRVDRVFDVRLVVRRTIRYALARLTIVLAATVPLVALIVSSVRHREEPLGAVLTGTGSASVLIWLVITGIAFAASPTVLRWIDRRFFGTELDRRALLAALAGRASTGDLRRDCVAFGEQLRAALRVWTAEVLVLDDDRKVFVSAASTLRVLPAASVIANELASDAPPLVVHVDRPSRFVARLPEDEKQWLADAGAHVLFPLEANGTLIGVLLTGEKLDELPFSRDELNGVSEAASALGLILENARLRRSSRESVGVIAQPAATEDAAARVCERCLAVAPPQEHGCPTCGDRLRDATLPILLAGKFVVKRELGRGGMGVVYEGIDLELQRRIALKTLPRVSAAQGARLRREARAMAAFAHPNLATVFAIESWRGAPVLVIELLDGGTLDARLRRSRLSPMETIAVGRGLVSALEVIHAAGLLHRDIKPSNIGFTQDGVAKLLDFGIAQMMETDAGANSSAKRPFVRNAVGTRSRIFAGTPGYMAPEALAGALLDSSVDMWSLGVVFYESLTGRRPFGTAGPDGAAQESAPDVRAVVPRCPESLAILVADLLCASPARRPRAPAVGVRLRECAKSIGGD